MVIFNISNLFFRWETLLWRWLKKAVMLPRSPKLRPWKQFLKVMLFNGNLLACMSMCSQNQWHHIAHFCCLCSSGKLEDAIEHLTKAILLNTKSAIMYATRGTFTTCFRSGFIDVFFFLIRVFISIQYVTLCCFCLTQLVFISRWRSQMLPYEMQLQHWRLVLLSDLVTWIWLCPLYISNDTIMFWIALSNN